MLIRPELSVAIAASVALPLPADTCFGSEKLSPPFVERENMITFDPGPLSSHATLIASAGSIAISGSNAEPGELDTSMGSLKDRPKSVDRAKRTFARPPKVSPQTRFTVSPESSATRGKNDPPLCEVTLIGALNFVFFLVLMM